MAMNETGTTGDAYAQIYNETRTTGMLRSGAVKNTGGLNSITVRVRQEDAFGGAEQSDESVVLPGLTHAFNTFTGQLGVQAPAAALRIDVKSTVPTMASDYQAVVADGAD